MVSSCPTRTGFRSSSPWLMLVLAGGVAACSADTDAYTVGDGAVAASPLPPEAGAPLGSGGSGVASLGIAGAPAIDLTQPPAPESAGSMVLRRLTFSEYDNILADLLGDTTAPAEDPSQPWVSDAIDDSGFTTPTITPDELVPLLESSANAVVETALAAGKLGIPCTNPSPAAEAACVTEFITTFGLKAFRRPLEAAEVADAQSLFDTERGLGLAFADSVATIAKGMLQAASFLYHWEIGPTRPPLGPDGLVPLTPWQIASRLASNLWNGQPDERLLQAAATVELSTPAEIAAEAARLIADPRHARALLDFHQQWLFRVGTRQANLAGIIPRGGLTPEAIRGLPTELSSFLASVYVTGDGTLAAFLTAPQAFVNRDLAEIYGVPTPATPFGGVMLDPKERAGLFTQVAFLASFALGDLDDPFHRGLSVYQKLLCGYVPPIGSGPALEPLGTKTTRQAFVEHARCGVGCHSLFDPPGFAFENYDATGKFRTTDNGVPVDSTGTFVTPLGATLTFANAIDLMRQLAALPETAMCTERQWTRYMFGRMETTPDLGSLQIAYQKAAAIPGFSLRDMLTSLVSSKAYLWRQPAPGESF